MFSYRIREANISDHDLVRDISKGIYLDTDFTPNIFPEWLADERWLLYVAETDLGRVVAFLALSITDGGESVVVRSSRVAEEYRGQGIYKRLLNTALKFAKKRVTGLSCIIRARPAHIRIPHGYRILKVSSKIIVSCRPTTVDAVTLSQIPGAMTPSFDERFLSAAEFSRLYNEELAFRCLFTGDILTIEGETFHLNKPANWEYLEKRNDISIHYTKYTEAADNGAAVISVLCAASKMTNEDKPYVTINIFGKEAKMVGYHILKAMKTTKLLVGCDFCLGLFVDVELEGLLLEELEFCKVLWQRRLIVQAASFDAHFNSGNK